MHISLLLPEILGQVERQDTFQEMAASVDLDGIEWLLTLAKRRPLPVDSPAASCAAAPAGLPAAALSYLYDFGQPPPGPVLRADPVHLAADRDCVRLLAARLDDLDMAASQQLIDEINQLFADEPWQLLAGTAQRWYLLVAVEPAIRTRAPTAMLGDNIHAALPVGDDARYWRKIINEIQMLMYSSPVNQRRQTETRLMANSLWLWGEGPLMDIPALPWATVYSSDPVIAGYARHGGCKVTTAPLAADTLLNLTTDDPVLCQPPLAPGLPGLQAFNDSWARPLYKALRQTGRGKGGRRLRSVELLPGNGYSYQVLAGKHPWWRRRRRFDHFVAS